MRAFLSLVLLCLGSQSWAKNVDFKLEAVPLPKAVSVIYDEVLNKPYMLDPKLAEDKRLLSFHTTEEQDFNEFLTLYFENINIKGV